MKPRSVQAGVLWRSALGVVLAPVSFLCSGAVSDIHFAPTLMWLSVLSAMILVAVVILVSWWSPATGFVAGGILAILMFLFAIYGLVPSSRPELSFGGVLVRGGTGALSGALVGAYVTMAAVTIRSHRRRG